MSKKDDADIIIGHSPWEGIKFKAPLSLRQELAFRFVEAYAKGGYAPAQGQIIKMFASDLSDLTFALADKILESENV